MQGYILTALFIIPGTYTIGQLTCMADKGPTSDQYEIACLDPAFLEALKAGGKRNRERTKRKRQTSRTDAPENKRGTKGIFPSSPAKTGDFGGLKKS